MKLLERFVAFLNYHRRLVAAACAALSMAGLVSLLENRPLEGDPVVVLARDVAAGELLSPEDLDIIDVPPQLITTSALHDVEAAVGAVLTVAGDAGEMVTSHAILHGSTAETGFSLVPISIPDDDLRALLHPGQVVTLIVTFDGPPETLTDQARIAKLPASSSGGTLGGGTSPVLLVEVPTDVAHAVATLGQSGQLGVILSSR